MSRKKRTVAIRISQDDKFNSKGQFIAGFNQVTKRTKFGEIDREEVVISAVESLFLAIKIAKRNRRAIKSINLSKPFNLEVSGALELVLDGHKSTQTNVVVKFPAAVYKQSPDEAKVIVYELFMDMIQLADQLDGKINDDVKAFKQSVAELN